MYSDRLFGSYSDEIEIYFVPPYHRYSYATVQFSHSKDRGFRFNILTISNTCFVYRIRYIAYSKSDILYWQNVQYIIIIANVQVQSGNRVF